MRSQKKRTATKAELRALASAGLTAVRYPPGSERAEVREITPGARPFTRRLTGPDEAANESEANERS